MLDANIFYPERTTLAYSEMMLLQGAIAVPVLAFGGSAGFRPPSYFESYDAMRVFFTGAYRRPRELNWMIGMTLLVCTLMLGFTGYSLVFEQLSYWGATVAANISDTVPIVGPFMKQALLGGEIYNDRTLSRFFILHGAVLPVLLILVLMMHIGLVRLLGVTQLTFEGEEVAPARHFNFFPSHFYTELIIGLTLMILLSAPTRWLRRTFRALKRGDIKAMWIQTTNPWVTLPNRSRFDRTPNDGKFIVVSDIYPTPTTAMADLILPAAAWVEREGMFGNTERRTQHWDKMVEPPGEAREDAWAIIEVAKRMGMGSLFPWPADNWHEPMFEEYRTFGLGHGKDLASYAQLRETRGMVWPVVNGKETFYRYTAGYDPYVKKSQGAHFYKAVGYGEKAAFWLRPYHPPAESPDEQFPFWLTTGRVLEHWHSGSMTRRIKQLHQAVPAAYLEVNHADAEAMGIKKGDRVKIVSRRGSLELVAEVDGRGRPPRGTVFVPFFDEAKLINLVTLDAMDNISKQPDYKKCAIRIERI